MVSFSKNSTKSSIMAAATGVKRRRIAMKGKLVIAVTSINVKYVRHES